MKTHTITRVMVILLVTMLALNLTACGGSGGTADEAAESTPAPEGGTTESVAPESAEAEPAEVAALTLPIVDEPTKFTIWQPIDPEVTNQMEFLHESEYYKELERRTGVTIEFIHPAIGAEIENMNLMFGSGTYPDAVQIMASTGGYTYPGGLDKGIEDGVLLDTTELVQTLAPSYWEAINSDDEIRRQIITDGGNLPGFYQIMTSEQPPWFGLTTRQDWLDELGLDTPITYDDWHEALTLYKEEKGATSPMMMMSTGTSSYDVFNSGYDFAGGFFQIDKVLHYGPLEPSFKEYLTMMHQWFEEGLIDPDFASRNDFLGPSDYSTTGKTGLWQDVYVLFPINQMQAAAADADYRCVAVPNPVRTEGQTVHLACYNPRVGFLWAMTDACSDPETFTKWMEYTYSEEGTVLANYGIEGDTFNYNAEGTPELTAKMTADPNLSMAGALRQYTKMSSGGYLYDWRRELSGAAPDVLAALDIWGGNVDYSYIMPPITLNADEGSEFAQIMGDIDTYKNEMIAKYINGVESLDNFDSFISTIESLNISRAMELQQGALDRYYAR